MTEKEYEQEIKALRECLKETRKLFEAYYKSANLLYKYATEEDQKQIEEYLKDV